MDRAVCVAAEYDGDVQSRTRKRSSARLKDAGRKESKRTYAPCETFTKNRSYVLPYILPYISLVYLVP